MQILLEYIPLHAGDARRGILGLLYLVGQTDMYCLPKWPAKDYEPQSNLQVERFVMVLMHSSHVDSEHLYCKRCS